MPEQWHSLTSSETLSRLKTTHEGLSESEAKVRLTRHGPNELAEQARISLWLVFLRQFRSPLVYVLLAASLLKFAVGGFLDGSVILAVLIFMAVTGFVQESRAEQAMEALRRLAAPKARVRREGTSKTVPASRLVPGDIVVLEAGDKVSADARLLESTLLQVNESSLTGESMPVDKHSAALEDEVPLPDRRNLLFSGTALTRGRAVAVVTTTGMQTEIGKIASAIKEISLTATPLQRSIQRLSNLILVLVLGVSILLVIVGVQRGMEWLEVFLLAVAAAVAAVPEGLPAAVTVVLATGMRIMARRNAIIRKMVAVETLGSATVICSDKTGTLTHGEMTIKRIYLPGRWVEVTGRGYSPEGGFQTNGQAVAPSEDRDLRLLLTAGTLCNDSLLTKNNGDWTVMGDPTEGALVVAGAKAGMDKEKLEESYPRLDEIPFQSERLYMATLHESDKGRVVYLKGAPEKVLSMSRYILKEGAPAKIGPEEKEHALQANQEMALNAMRVLAIGYLDCRSDQRELQPKAIEDGLVFAGLVGMSDPPRQEAKQAVSMCKQAGIRVVMITGDNRVTAESIARQLSLPEGRAVTGTDLQKMGDDELSREVANISVFARIEPLHKLRIVNAYKAVGHTVAMTGDGINDAPALKAADIGIAMGITGTDVAKEASDMVLADDNFATVVAATEEGRAIFNRLRNVTVFLLSTGMGELLAVVFGVLIIGLAPLLALQILWINMVTGVVMAIPLGLEPKSGDELQKPPRHPRVGLIFPGMLFRVAFFAAMLGTSVLVTFSWTQTALGLDVARTIAFCSVVVFEWMVAFNVRSDEYTVFRLGVLRNRWLLAAVSVAIILQVAVIYLPFFQAAFETVPLSIGQWGIALVPGVLIAVIESLRKIIVPQLFSSGKWQPWQPFSSSRKHHGGLIAYGDGEVRGRG
jgi:P-type Ca2+ transporter type 2C